MQITRTQTRMQGYTLEEGGFAGADQHGQPGRAAYVDLNDAGGGLEGRRKRGASVPSGMRLARNQGGHAVGKIQSMIITKVILLARQYQLSQRVIAEVLFNLRQLEQIGRHIKEEQVTQAAAALVFLAGRADGKPLLLRQMATHIASLVRAEKGGAEDSDARRKMVVAEAGHRAYYMINQAAATAQEVNETIEKIAKVEEDHDDHGNHREVKVEHVVDPSRSELDSDDDDDDSDPPVGLDANSEMELKVIEKELLVGDLGDVSDSEVEEDEEQALEKRWAEAIVQEEDESAFVDSTGLAKMVKKMSKLLHTKLAPLNTVLMAQKFCENAIPDSVLPEGVTRVKMDEWIRVLFVIGSQAMLDLVARPSTMAAVVIRMVALILDLEVTTKLAADVCFVDPPTVNKALKPMTEAVLQVIQSQTWGTQFTEQNLVGSGVFVLSNLDTALATGTVDPNRKTAQSAVAPARRIESLFAKPPMMAPPTIDSILGLKSPSHLSALSKAKEGQMLPYRGVAKSVSTQAVAPVATLPLVTLSGSISLAGIDPHASPTPQEKEEAEREADARKRGVLKPGSYQVDLRHLDGDLDDEDLGGQDAAALVRSEEEVESLRPEKEELYETLELLTGSSLHANQRQLRAINRESRAKKSGSRDGGNGRNKRQRRNW